MTLDRWNNLSRVMRAPPDVPGNAPAAEAAAPAAEAAPAAAAPAAESAAPASPLASADAGKRDGAPAKESAPAADSAGDKTPAIAGDAPPPGGTEGKDAAKPEGDAAKPDAAADAAKKDAKPAETDKARPEGADAAADIKPEQAEVPPAPPPVYEAYKLPENLKLDDTRLKEFNDLLGKTELNGKADHAAMQALGQELVEFYGKEVQRIGQQVQKYQVDVWNRHLEGELNTLKSDPQLGGNRIDTTLGNAKYVLEQFGGSKDEQDRFMATLDRAGVSSNRDFVAMLNRMFERYREPQPVPPNLPSVKTNGAGQRNWYDTVDVGKA